MTHSGIWAQSPRSIALVCLALASLVFTKSGENSAQGIPNLRSAPPSARSTHEFTVVSAVRELPSGQVLVIDRHSAEAPIVLVDFEKDVAKAVGRRGAGPGEFQQPFALVPLGGDTSLISDGGLNRWLILSAGTIVRTQTDGGTIRLGMLLGGGDRRGRVLGLRGFRISNPSRVAYSVADSVFAIVGNLQGSTLDTVARMRGAGGRMQRVRLVGAEVGALDHFLNNPLLVHDQAVLYPDGWVAVASANPYRVVWIPPKGELVYGEPFASQPQALTELERRAALTRAFAGLDSRATPTSALVDWPENLPPFLEEALLPLPTGHLMIRRTPAAGESVTKYEVINRRGTLVAVLEIQVNQRLVGVGGRGAYVAVTDDDGLSRLYRHPFPSLLQ